MHSDQNQFRVKRRGWIAKLVAAIRKVLQSARRHPKISSTLVIFLLLAFVGKIAGEFAAFQRVKFVLDEKGGKTLVVILHGWTSGPWFLRDVAEIARREYDSADILLPDYPANFFSDADPRLIANAIESRINALHEERQYDEIVLVGFSMGALLIRKVFLWGLGGEWANDRSLVNAPHSWVKRVRRIVLLAGQNRGWSISGHSEDPSCRPMSAPRRLSNWLMQRFVLAIGTGGFIMSGERGAPFVADLRVQWIRLARPDPEDPNPPHLPTVIQLLGDKDSVVTVCDNKDLEASKDFLFINVPQTGHAGIIRASPDAPPGSVRETRAKLIREALSSDLDQLRKQYLPDGQPEDPEIEHVVFVLHGIRDFGEWTTGLADAIRRKKGHVAITSSYGYFPIARFLIYGARDRNVRWFMDQYTQAVARYPQAEISYIGHSNGTYLLASGLEEYRSLKVKRVLFAGSVVPSKYAWDRFIVRPEGERQVQDVRNIVSSADWVVGIFPRFFELITELTPINPEGYFDIGAAGFRGFTERDYNVAFVRGGHSAAIQTEDRKIEAIVNFIYDGDESGFEVFRESAEAATLVSWLSKLCWLVMLLLLGLILGMGLLIRRRTRDSPGPLLRWAPLAYTVFILCLLYTL